MNGWIVYTDNSYLSIVMENITKPKIYRDFIDTMVEICHKGQGQIGPSRVKEGVWNKNSPTLLNDFQNRVNDVLKRLSVSDRQTIANLLEESFEEGVFETIKCLEEFQIEPFTDGYEDSPYCDFIGRLDKVEKWPWPEKD